MFCNNLAILYRRLNPMSIFDDKANAVASELVVRKVDNRVAFDPTIIFLIIGILKEIIKAFQDCKKSSTQVASSAHSIGILERFRLRRMVRQHLNDEEMHSHLGNQLFDSIIEVGKSV